MRILINALLAHGPRSGVGHYTAQWHPAERVAWFERHFPRALRQCVHYFTDSEAARREIVQVLGVPASRVTRTYSGIRPGLRPLPPREVRPALDTLGLPPRYLLSV